MVRCFLVEKQECHVLSTLATSSEELCKLAEELLLVEQKCLTCKHNHVAAPVMDRKQKESIQDSHPSTQYCPADITIATVRQIIYLEAQRLVHLCQHHVCGSKDSSTCYKYFRAMLAKNSSLARVCRFGFPRKLVSSFAITPEGQIMLQRLNHRINNYNPLMLALLRCNHDITHFWGSDANVMAASYYATNYTTKINKTLISRFPIFTATIARYVEEKEQGKYNGKTIEREALSLIAKLHNQMQRDAEFSLPDIVASLYGLPERFSSHRFRKANIFPFLEWAEDSDKERNYNGANPEYQHAGELFGIEIVAGKYQVTSQRADYVLRPAGLENLCYWDFVRYWEKMALKGNKSSECRLPEFLQLLPAIQDDKKRYPFQHNHPEYTSHVLRHITTSDAFCPMYTGPAFPSRKILIS